MEVHIADLGLSTIAGSAYVKRIPFGDHPLKLERCREAAAASSSHATLVSSHTAIVSSHTAIVEKSNGFTGKSNTFHTF